MDAINAEVKPVGQDFQFQWINELVENQCQNPLQRGEKKLALINVNFKILKEFVILKAFHITRNDAAGNPIHIRQPGQKLKALLHGTRCTNFHAILRDGLQVLDFLWERNGGKLEFRRCPQRTFRMRAAIMGPRFTAQGCILRTHFPTPSSTAPSLDWSMTNCWDAMGACAQLLGAISSKFCKPFQAVHLSKWISERSSSSSIWPRKPIPKVGEALLPADCWLLPIGLTHSVPEVPKQQLSENLERFTKYVSRVFHRPKLPIWCTSNSNLGN